MYHYSIVPLVAGPAKLSKKTIINARAAETILIFDGKMGGYEDFDLPNPVTEQGRQKAIVEEEIPNLTDNYLIARLTKIYGIATPDGTLIEAMARDLISGHEVVAASD